MEIKESFQRGAEIWGRIIIPKDWVMSGREMPSDHLFPYLPIHPNTKAIPLLLSGLVVGEM